MMKMKNILLSCLLLLSGHAMAYKLQSIDINVNGQTRNMLCYTPNTMQANMPLWIVTHGMNQDPEYQRNNDHLYELIDTEKFVVCYLRSDGTTWDIGGQKDLNFVRQTITEMATKFNINKNRVYWSGFSMGSMLIYHGIENGMDEVITAFAPCSGVKHGSPWVNCKRPINLIHCHGNGDTVFPIDEYKPRDYAYHFVEIDKCKTYKKTENYKAPGGYDAGVKEVWTDGTNGTSVEIFMADNHGHWPSVNYTRETWNFCKQFSKATPAQEYQSALKQAKELLEQWEGDINIFTGMRTKYNTLKTTYEKYLPELVDQEDETAIKTATSKLNTAISNFTTQATTSSKTSKKVTKSEFDPNFHIYLCFGQSNMEGNATPELEDYSGSSTRFLMMAPVTMSSYSRTKGSWYVARPPLCRDNTGLTPADYFGKTMVKNLPDSISVGVINVSLGGCAIEMFNEDGISDYIKQQADWLQAYAKNYQNNPFRYLVNLAKNAQKVGVIKGILLHQGCSNNTQQDWPNKVNVIYKRLLNELNLDQNEVPLLVGELLQQNQGGVCWGHNSVIAKVPSIINNGHVVSSANCPGASDGLHFTAKGYRMIGENYANVMLKLLERYIKKNDYTIKTLKAQEASFNMTASSFHPLYIMLTDQDGEVHDVTAACEFTSSDPSILSFSGVNAASGNCEGDVTVTATFTNDKGEKASVEFKVSVRLFPLTEDSFNPSLLETGTYKYMTQSEYGRYTSKKGGMGGWTFGNALDLSDYKYLVVKTKSTSKPTLRIYDVNDVNSTSYFEVSMAGTGDIETVVKLSEMKDAEGKTIDPSHIYIVGVTAANTYVNNIKGVRVTNEDPTAMDIILKDELVQPSQWYDMTGRKVSRPQHGVYIKQGKKVLK